MVARRFLNAGREGDVHQLLSEIMVGARKGRLKNPAAAFIARIKEFAQLTEIDI